MNINNKKDQDRTYIKILLGLLKECFLPFFSYSTVWHILSSNPSIEMFILPSILFMPKMSVLIFLIILFIASLLLLYLFKYLEILIRNCWVFWKYIYFCSLSYLSVSLVGSSSLLGRHWQAHTYYYSRPHSWTPDSIFNRLMNNSDFLKARLTEHMFSFKLVFFFYHTTRHYHALSYLSKKHRSNSFSFFLLYF